MRSVERPFTAKCASIIARSVRRHRPQSPPAPHASAICFDVQAPLATASLTAWLVTPMHRQTNIAAPSTRLFDSHEMGELADELGRIGAETGVAHPLRGGVGMLDPLPGADLVLDLLEDHHFVTVVEGAVDPDLAHAAALETVETVVHLDHQRRHIPDGGHHAHHDLADVLFGRRAVQIDLLDDLAAEY